MKRISYGFVICFLLIFSVFLPAQTAAEIEEMLKSEALSYEEAALFVLKAADLPKGQPDLNDTAEAFRFAADQKWLPKDAVAGGEANLKGVSLLLVGSFNVRGGVFFSIFKNPHYAYRELVYQDVIQGRVDPEMVVSGSHLLFLVSRLLSRQEEDAEFASRREEQARLAAEAEQQKRLAAEAEQQARLAAEAEQQKRLAAEAEQQRRLAAEAELRKRAQEEAEQMERQRLIAEAQRQAERQALAAEINTRLQSSAVEDTSARITDEGVTISLSNIQFSANSAELPESEKRKLQEIARILQTVSKRKILVTGHTALAGTVADRLKTSQERAAAVAAYLVSLGARRSNEVFAQGYGSERPIASNSTPQGMALNRRVEITILEDQ